MPKNQFQYQSNEFYVGWPQICWSCLTICNCWCTWMPQTYCLFFFCTRLSTNATEAAHSQSHIDQKLLYIEIHTAEWIRKMKIVSFTSHFMCVTHCLVEAISNVLLVAVIFLFSLSLFLTSRTTARAAVTAFFLYFFLLLFPLLSFYVPNEDIKNMFRSFCLDW